MVQTKECIAFFFLSIIIKGGNLLLSLKDLQAQNQSTEAAF
jgi:hypothetical protein